MTRPLFQPAYPGQEYPFSIARNFRELGGYPTRDGRIVRYGQFFRCGALAKVLTSAEDRRLFDSLGVRTVFDLRATTERARKPDPQLPGVRVCQCSGMWNADGSEMDFDPEDLASHQKLIQELAAGDDDFDEAYARMPFRNPAFRQLFASLREGETPLLFHCSAGKDRTGVAALLILLLLGVSREAAVQDYLLTNRWRAAAIEASMERYSQYLEQTPKSREMFTSLEGVIEYNIGFTLRAIEERYPTYEDYFADEYGIDAECLTRLRDRYLQQL